MSTMIKAMLITRVVLTAAALFVAGCVLSVADTDFWLRVECLLLWFALTLASFEVLRSKT